MRKILSRAFFAQSVLRVAPRLLGKFLVRRFRGKERACLITEVEAYDGPGDLACHGAKGRTKRNEVMFGEAGRWYVYLVHGLYSMLNIITGSQGYPAGILVRGVEGIEGPGRLTKALHIGRALNGKKAVKKGGLWIEDRGFKVRSSQIKRTPRIGVDYAGKVWVKKPYRFILKVKKINRPTGGPITLI